jgi:serine/threonine-protein kinase
MSLTAGAIVGRFRVTAPIGSGATGAVYLAEDSGTGDRVALKVLALDLTEDERLRQRFERESTLAAALEHPNVVRTLEAGEVDGALYLAMEYVDGPDLREILRREGRLSPGRALALVDQVAQALDAAHAAGLVHRDVKPGNILVAGELDTEHAYLCDFGLARHVSSVSSLTGDRGFVGTIDYVAPEQIEGGTIDGRADQYALACVLFECLTGVRPFERESELSVVYAHLNEAPPKVGDGLPEAYDAVFATALAKSPGDRYRSCSELVAAARAAQAGRVRRRRSNRGLVAAGALVALAAGAAGVLIAAESGAAHHGAIQITQSEIDGVSLGHGQAYYTRRLGGFRAQTLSGPGYPSLDFQGPEIAVYFPAKHKPAHIITTWNKDFRTAAGIGPCSTIDSMKKAYGASVKPTWSGSQHGKVFSYAVGNNLLFSTDNRRTVTAVVLYRGDPRLRHGGVPQEFANYVGADETACE